MSRYRKRHWKIWHRLTNRHIHIGDLRLCVRRIGFIGLHDGFGYLEPGAQYRRLVGSSEAGEIISRAAHKKSR